MQQNELKITILEDGRVRVGTLMDKPRQSRYWWRILKYARVTFGKCLKTAVVIYGPARNVKGS
jgi:hypothetical protein